jgi:tetratricopeptide (TPR) repeat protein
MALNRPKSPKERRDAKNARSFIGRTEQQYQFQQSLNQPDHVNAKLIFGVSGQGGVGKTTLLNEFRRIAEEYGHVVAYVDEGVATNRVDDVPEAMHRLAEDLAGQGFKCEEFRKRYKDYRVKKQEMEADPEAPKGMLREVTRGATKMALNLGKSSIPIVGEMIDTESIASGVGDAVSYGWERFRNKDEERLIKETLEILTPLFLEGVRQIPVDKHVVLMFDAYEVTGDFLDGWIRALLDDDYGVLDIYLLVCIGGRNPLDKNAWTKWETSMARSPLEPFTEEEARELLVTQGIQSEAVIQEIWRLSSDQSGAMGLPLLVSWMAAAAPTSAYAVVDPCEDAVNRFLKWETDGAKRDLAQDAACARVLNADVVAALEQAAQFGWLRSCAFVLKEGAGWRYHSIVREQMLRYLGQKSPKRYAEVHGKLAAYYDGLRNGLGVEATKEAKDKTWREYSLEWIYHELCAAPQAKQGLALNGFLHALKESRDFAKAWSEAMHQAGKESKCESLRRWGDLLYASVEFMKMQQCKDVMPCLTVLLAEILIEENLKSVIFHWRGECYWQLGNQELALKDVLKAIQIDEKNPRFYFDLGLIYKNLNRYRESISSFQKVISLQPDSSGSHYNIGIIQHDQENYKEAIISYQKVIELVPQFAGAYCEIGLSYKESNQYEAAIFSCQQSLSLDPKYERAYYVLGLIHKEKRNYEAAIDSYQKAISLNPKNEYAHTGLGRVYKEKRSYEAAIDSYQKAISLNPKNAYNYIWIGLTFYEKRDYLAAVRAYRKSISLNPKNPYPHNNLGLIYKDQKQWYPAIKAFKKALSLPNSLGSPASAHTLAYCNLGDVYKAQRCYKDAINAYEKAISINSDYVSALVGRGQLYWLTKQYEKAIQDINKAINIDPELFQKMTIPISTSQEVQR